MAFILNDGSSHIVTVEQAGEDVLVRVDAVVVFAMRGETWRLQTISQAATQLGLTLDPA